MAPGDGKDASGPEPWLARVRLMLPVGSSLPRESWELRHRLLVLLLLAHVPVLGAFGVWRGFEPLHVLAEVGALGVAAVVGSLAGPSRVVRASVVSVGLLSCSALLTHLSGGYIEAHFHFFVMIIVISAYQEWVPFTLAIGYVLVHHGVVGVLEPTSVYNHPDAIAHPWKWAAIHALFVSGASIASIVNWRLSEQARARQVEAERRLEAVLTSAPVLLFATDPRGRLTRALGRGLAATLGNRPEDVVGRPVSALFPGAPGVDEAVASALRGQPASLTLQAGGRVYDVRCSAVADDFAQPGVIGVATDVTDERRAQDAERAARERLVEQLREVDRFKTELLNLAAHELATPLTPLRMQVDLLKTTRASGLSDKQRSSILVLDRSLDRLTVLVRDVLDVARLQSGRLPLQREVVRMDQLVAEVVEAYDEAASRVGVALQARVPAGLCVLGDPARLGQVLYNLVSNAVKFTPPGGRVELEAATEGGFALVRVRDTGLGLTPEQMARLFQPFSRAHEHHRTEGTGLGLFISKGIVEQHGGRLWCESAGPGQGATFVAALPLAPEASDAAPEPRPDPAAAPVPAAAP